MSPAISHAGPLISVTTAVVVLAVAVVVVIYRRRRRVVYHDRAVELRQHAAFQSESLPQLLGEARDARARATEARRRAEQLEQEAREKESALERARSRVEGTVREADRIDPAVRHRAAGYSPSFPADDDHPSASEDQTGTGPSHRQSGDSSPA